MLALAVVAVTGFSGYAALLPVAPLWAVHGGADSAGAGLVNFVLLGATVATQFAVPAIIRAIGWGHALAFGMVLLGVPALLHVATDALAPTLALSAVRGLGFGILTVAASAAAVLIVVPARRGAAVGAYSAALSVPVVVLMPIGAFIVDVWDFWPVFAISAAPLLGIPACYRLSALLPDRTTADSRHPEVTGEVRGGPSAYLGVVSPTLVLLAITLAARSALHFAVTGGRRGGRTRALLTLPLVPLRDTLNLFLWGAGFVRRRVAWAGRNLDFDDKGLFRDIYHDSNRPEAGHVPPENTTT